MSATTIGHKCGWAGQGGRVAGGRPGRRRLKEKIVVISAYAGYQWVVDWAGWAIFGLPATAALTAVLIGAQLSGRSRMDVPMLLGTLFVADPDRARLAGAALHLVNGQFFALFYAAAFARLGQASWWLGGAFGLVHGLVALVFVVPLLPGVHPRMGSDRSGPATGAVLEPPGLLSVNYGRATPAVTLLAHVAYGIALGLFLRPG